MSTTPATTNGSAPAATGDDRRRWLALYVLCTGMLMIVVDGTIVNVALPTIQDDLGFSQSESRLGGQRVHDPVRRIAAPGRALR